MDILLSLEPNLLPATTLINLVLWLKLPIKICALWGRGDTREIVWKGGGNIKATGCLHYFNKLWTKGNTTPPGAASRWVGFVPLGNLFHHENKVFANQETFDVHVLLICLYIHTHNKECGHLQTKLNHRLLTSCNLKTESFICEAALMWWLTMVSKSCQLPLEAVFIYICLTQLSERVRQIEPNATVQICIQLLVLFPSLPSAISTDCLVIFSHFHLPCGNPEPSCLSRSPDFPHPHGSPFSLGLHQLFLVAL